VEGRGAQHHSGTKRPVYRLLLPSPAPTPTRSAAFRGRCLAFGRSGPKDNRTSRTAKNPGRANFPHGPPIRRRPFSVLPFTVPANRWATPAANAGGYSGRAAIPKASASEAELLAPSHRATISAYPYRSPLPQAGRRGTFTGQCCLPLCPGETASHLRVAERITAFPVPRTGSQTDPTLQPNEELGAARRPNRDSSRTRSPWPLRHRSLRTDTGCLPRSTRVRGDRSEQARTRPGRIRTFEKLSSHRVLTVYD
jgi:hypothetical protein